MIDASFVKQLQDGFQEPTEIIDTGYNQKVVVIHSPGSPSERVTFVNPKEYEPTVLVMSTLTGIADYIKNKVADLPVIVQVLSPTEVRVVAPVEGVCRQQLVYAKAVPNLPQIQYGSRVDMETFLIQLQTCFVQEGDIVELRKLCATITSINSTEVKDDGVSQAVNVKTGITRSGSATVKPQWELAPFRTFPEIQPPVSPFLVRMKQPDPASQVVCSIHEADGGAWRVTAIAAIGAWLRNTLGEDVVILA